MPDNPYLPKLAHGNLLVALNKTDLPQWRDVTQLLHTTSASAPFSVPISALTGDGIDDLLQSMARHLGGDADESAVILTTARQKTAVSSCLGHVQKATLMLKTQQDLELAAADLRLAREQLAALWGRSATEEMIDAIFSTFCLGK